MRNWLDHEQDEDEGDGQNDPGGNGQRSLESQFAWRWSLRRPDICTAVRPRREDTVMQLRVQTELNKPTTEQKH